MRAKFQPSRQIVHHTSLYLPADRISQSTAHGNPSSLTRTPRGAGIILIFAIIAGQLQNLTIALAPNLGVVNYVDDGLVALALAASLPRLSKVPGLPILLASLAIACLAFAAVASTTTASYGPDDVFFQFRQAAVPAILILTGLALTSAEWRWIGITVIAVGLINVGYVAIEEAFGRPVEPIEIQQGKYVGYFFGEDILTGARITRAGGLLLNPPTLGLFLAAALAFAVHLKRIPARWVIVALLATALWATASRGGLLAAAVAVALPAISRKIGAAFGVATLTIFAVPIGLNVMEHAGSARHVNGLAAGIADAFSNPAGRGFGLIGNFRDSALTEAPGESLLAIPFSAAGLVLVVLTLALIAALIAKMRWPDGPWEAALALGCVAAACFAETASALNGTIPLWLAAGIAIASRRDASV